MDDRRLFKRSQRPTWSCAECSRRKIKCNKRIPCQPCIQRGRVCSLDYDGSVVGGSSSSSSLQHEEWSGSGVNPASPEMANASINSAVRTLQSTVRDLERRLTAVEDSTGSSSIIPSASSNIDSPASTSRNIIKNVDDKSKREDLADKALTFEYLALGKDRTRGILQHSNSQSSIPHTKNILQDNHKEALSNSIRAALLPRKSLEYILTFAKDVIAWQHGCIHTLTFHRECEAFLSMGELQRWYWTDPLWLAVFFVVQSIAVHQMPLSDLSSILADHHQSTSPLAESLLQAAMSCLDAGHYLSKPSFYTCQALAILCVCGHNVTESNLLSSYLAIGIKTAQTLNLHGLGSESARIGIMVKDAGGSIQDDSTLWKRRIIDLEMGKRIWWSFVQQEYFAIPFRGTSCVNPKHHDTPFPLNVNDDGLDRGQLESEYTDIDLTLVSKLRVTATAAQIVFDFFEALPESSPRVEEHVSRFEARLLSLIPTTSQYKSSNPSFKFGLALRRYINISISHKILVLHRAFCSRQPALSSQLLESQIRCVEVSRQILEQIKSITRGSSRPEGQIGAIWTISYQAVAAATVIALTFFQEGGILSVAEDMTKAITRSEVLDAVNILEELASRSTIAERGVKMINDLIKGFSQSDGGNIVKRKSVENKNDEDLNKSHQKRARIEENILDENHDTFDLDWDQFPGIAGVLDSMPDVSKLFDGSIGNPFSIGY